MRRTLALGLLALMAIAGNAFGQAQARITGKVTDAVTKAPIENATIHVEAIAGKTFKEDFKTKKDGTYAIFLLDGTIKYKFTWSAPGYAPYAEDMKLQIAGAPNTKDVQLQSGTAAPAAGNGAAKAPEAKGDPAVEAFNEGAKLANAGDNAGAIKKMTEAVTLKPDLIAGWEALANLQLRQKDYKPAIEAAKKALSFADDETEMWQVLFEAYTATGDKAGAAEAKKKLPANAGSLFNDAAKLINAGKDAEAESLLKQSIAADPKFAQAYYELGMVYVRTQKNADAKANLEKYLELEPNGKDAATAKEMLQYVK
ncbi:MAG TPA: carboxypeptidase regulatory-like domain-containing protein [Thermoanaerobaculia bacterium]|nr:carboxypeptidase regulatory-like domain-containing protein [Thermoanaerobaculia bacterium]